MKRLILTTNDSGSGALKGARIADAVIGFGHRFVWRPLPSDAELAASLMPLSSLEGQAENNWLSRIYRKHLGDIDSRTGLIDLCEPFDAIDLWIDPDPNAQQILFWLLDYLRPHEKIVSKLSLVQADTPIGSHLSEEIAAWRLPSIKILNGHIEIARSAWQACRAPTPQDWFDLLSKDLSPLPWLRQAVVELLEELPMRATGLGATEMRMLELISEGNAAPYDVFPGHEKRNERRVLGYWHNPIHRWWGGTELTNNRLWRWDPVKQALVEPE